MKRIPPGTRYVGIGVGKRVSPAFMKVAAERTGGLFTQVNPDEPISLARVRNRVHAERPAAARTSACRRRRARTALRFLTFSNALAHGEELAAVANVTHAMPRVGDRSAGLLDGQPFEKMLPVEKVAAGAGYLPRTWAKLEIDRLLAEDSQRQQEGDHRPVEGDVRDDAVHVAARAGERADVQGLQGGPRPQGPLGHVPVPAEDPGRLRPGPEPAGRQPPGPQGPEAARERRCCKRSWSATRRGS